MNNSVFTPDPQEPDNSAEKRRERETELVRIVEAIGTITQTAEWDSLRELVFDKSKENLESRLLNEVKKHDLNLPEIYRLQGQLESHKKHSLDTLLVNAQAELINLRKRM